MTGRVAVKPYYGVVATSKEIWLEISAMTHENPISSARKNDDPAEQQKDTVTCRLQFRTRTLQHSALSPDSDPGNSRTRHTPPEKNALPPR